MALNSYIPLYFSVLRQYYQFSAIDYHLFYKYIIFKYNNYYIYIYNILLRSFFQHIFLFNFGLFYLYNKIVMKYNLVLLLTCVCL